MKYMFVQKRWFENNKVVKKNNLCYWCSVDVELRVGVVAGTGTRGERNAFRRRKSNFR